MMRWCSASLRAASAFSSPWIRIANFMWPSLWVGRRNAASPIRRSRTPGLDIPLTAPCPRPPGRPQPRSYLEGEARPPLAVDPGDAGPERAQLALDVLVAAIDLLDAANDGAAVGAEGGDDEGDAGPDVRARDPGRFASQARRPLDEGAMRVAQDHTGAHP